MPPQHSGNGIRRDNALSLLFPPAVFRVEVGWSGTPNYAISFRARLLEFGIKWRPPGSFISNGPGVRQHNDEDSKRR